MGVTCGYYFVNPDNVEWISGTLELQYGSYVYDDKMIKYKGNEENFGIFAESFVEVLWFQIIGTIIFT